MSESREGASQYVAYVGNSWFGPLSEKDADYLRKKSGSVSIFSLRELVPPEFFPEGRGWVVLINSTTGSPRRSIRAFGHQTGCGGERTRHVPMVCYTGP